MKLLYILLAGLISSTGMAAGHFDFNPRQTIEIAGTIDGSKLGLMKQFDELSKEGEDIDVLINSPGGSYVVGSLIINSMKLAQSRGSRLRCVSTVLAASMAFQLLMNCDDRYAMENTRLLFHPPRISLMFATLLPNQIAIWLSELREIEAELVPHIKQVIGMPDNKFSYHYDNETLWPAWKLNDETENAWLQIVDEVNGVDNVFSMSGPSRGPSSAWSHGEIIYVCEKPVCRYD